MSIAQENQSAIFEPIKKQYEKMFRGFGRISKYAMSDTELPLTSKGIYAYVCSYTGADKAIAYPTVHTITKDLRITEKRFQKHMKILVEKGYIEISKARHGGRKHLHNVYTIVANPIKYKKQPQSIEEEELNNKVLMYGIQNIGYGTLTQEVMRDERLSITAKSIYAYFCSYAGNTNEAFPTRDTILYHLGITKPTYYTHYNQLLEAGYITTHTAYNAAKKRNMTTYIINDPYEFRQKTEHKNQRTKSSSESLNSESPSRLKKEGTNINRSFNINTLKINNNHQSNASSFVGVNTPTENQNINNDLTDFSEKRNFVLNQLISNKGIPKEYSETKGLLNIAVRILAEKQFNMSSPNTHNMILDCIVEMAYNSHTSDKYHNFIDMLNKFTTVKNTTVKFSWLADFEADFEEAAKKYDIKSFKAYTKASLFNFLADYDLKSQYSLKIESSSFELEEFFEKAVETGKKNNKFENFTSEELDVHMKNLLDKRKSGI